MKQILLGVTGSVAAFKALDIVRKFRKEGHNVLCVLTKEATQFVTPLSFATLSNNNVISDLFEPRKTPPHIEMAFSDMILIAPATYNFIGKVASGIADDLLSCVVAASHCPILFAPCMDTYMWQNKILQYNINKLKSIGYFFIDPDVGQLSTLKIGKGRFPDTTLIVAETYKIMNPSKLLTGKQVIVTAGRTEEDLDPVRCITNKSSGKMGYAIAETAKLQGANVILISGPSDITPPSGVEIINVHSSTQMANEVLNRIPKTDILIMAAAVTDYIPANYSNMKIKSPSLEVQFKRSQDILKLARKKKKKLFICGFALETDNLIENAKAKLKDKSLDLIAANDISALGSDMSAVTLIDKKLKIKKLPLLQKLKVAEEIIKCITNNPTL
ncbi:MAG: bifunctional phosphopantothenoylcysteine decarboxylase/phosphopantothenate--cysteine ligase CoaBC [Candidatus Stahlbacteria bacterium]|nr:bifunctional phosphopantothenoylcysteine decarboxylase/phosphopantothenate--cysteine ligase CoaBC [Candidatus Stahlbacteria bacterium]